MNNPIAFPCTSESLLKSNDTDSDKWIVGFNPTTEKPTGERIKAFALHKEAVDFIGTLPNHEQGIYYLDAPEELDSGTMGK